MKRLRNGFTLLEITIVVAVAAIFVTLVLPPIVSAITLVQREGTMLNMFRTADQAMGSISAALRPAILPMVTDCNPNYTSTADTNSFRYVINTGRGFGLNGCNWRRLFTRGSSFVPFTVPVHFQSTQNATDANDMPFLGMRLPDNRLFMGATYAATASDPNAYEPQIYAASGARTLHQALYSLDPSSFADASIVPIVPPVNPVPPNMGWNIFDESFAFPGALSGYAVIRFVPYRDPKNGNAPRILNETALGFDLNDDGTLADSFALGSLEIVYHDQARGATGPHPRKILTPPMVLLQMNTNTPSYVPLFRLVSWGNTSNAPTQENWTPNNNLTRGDGYTLQVNLLLFDQFSQQSPLAFGRGSRPFLTKRFESMIELRNMSRE